MRRTSVIECHADSLSCPLTQLYLPGVPGGQKTRVRHKQAQVQNSQQNEFKRQAQGAGASRGRCRARASATSRKTRKIRQTFRSCLSSLTRSCIQDCVQEVPVKQVAQGTPPPRRTPRPSQVASTGFINFSMAFLPSLK